MKGNLKCPRCGSDGIQKVRILCEAGTSSIKMTSSGMGVTGGGNVGVGVPTTTGGTQTELSKKLSPPTKPQRRTGLILGVFALIILGISYTIGVLVGGKIVHSLFGIGFMSVGFFLIKSMEESLKKARAQYRVDYANWGRLWFCNRCGDTSYVE